MLMGRIRRSQEQIQQRNMANENGGGERGRDVLATETATGKKYVFQCKRVEKFDPNAVERELSTFARNVSEDPSIRPDVYVFFLACSINDQVKSRGENLAQQIGMEIEYWSKGTIDRLVRTNKRISDRFWRVVAPKALRSKIVVHLGGSTIMSKT